MKEPNLNSPKTTGVTPGVILRTTREQQGLSIADVAARLCLMTHFVEDIERDDYSQMSARVYARGHVISYAHLLGIPETQITTALNNVSMDFVAAPSVPSVDNERALPIYQPREPSQSRSGLLLWGSILVVLIVIGLAVMWWKNPISNDKVPSNAIAGNSTAIPIQSPPPASPAAAPAPRAPLPVTPSVAPAAPVAQPSNSAAANTSTNVPLRATAPATRSANDQSVVQPSEVSHDTAANSAEKPAVALPAPGESSDD